MGNIWRLIQIVLKERLLKDLVKFDPNLPQKRTGLKLKLSAKIHFNFQTNFSQGGKKKSMKKKNESPLAKYFTFTAYNLTWLVGLLDSFVVSAESITEESGDDLNVVREYLNEGIEKAFIVQVDEEYVNALVEDLRDLDRSKKVKMTKDLFTPLHQKEDSEIRNVCLDETTQKFRRYINEVILFATAITPPAKSGDVIIRAKFREKFFDIIVSMLRVFSHSLRTNFHQAIENTYVSGWIVERPSAILPVLNKDPRWLSIYHEDIALTVKRKVMREISERFEMEMREVFDKHLFMLTSLYEGSHHGSLLIKESSSFIVLAHLHNTIEWASDFVRRITSKRDDQEQSLYSIKENGEISKVISVTEMETIDIERDEDEECGDSERTRNYRLVSAPRNIRNFAEQMGVTGNFCLFAMKMDLRSRTNLYMSEILLTNYFLDEVPTEPDIFIQNLNNDVSRIERALRKFLSSKKIKYLFHGMSGLVAHFMINCLDRMKFKKFNMNGIIQIEKNILSLQQSLNNILEMDDFREREAHFAAILQFYQLIKLTPEELYTKIKTKDLYDSYTLEQFTSILELENFVRSDMKKKINNFIHSVKLEEI